MDRSGTLAAASGRCRTDSPQGTRALGRALGAAALPGTLVALIGPLGAGKTEMTKGIAEGLDVRSVVNSPTFILMNEHAGRLPLFHIDAYRLADPEEALVAGLFDERQADGVTVVEWADRLLAVLPAERLEVTLTPDPDGGDGRALEWHATDAEHARLAAAALPKT